MKSIAMSYHKIENFLKAIEYFQNVLNIDAQDGVSWGYLGYCLVMIDDLPKAFSAYQQAFNNLRNSEDPLLWYGIGIMYERFECLEYSEEAFCQVIKINPNFEKANEIYFRLGIIYKLQREFKQSLGCFQYILHNPPEPLTDTDVWFQIGLIHEQEKDYEKAREAYECVLIKNPDHVKVLQHLGCIFHQSASPFCNQDIAINYLTKSLEADYEDALTWYYLGRCNIAQKDFVKAYESLQQAVHRDNKNAAIWFSIGSMYFQTNRHHDAHDAYSQALKLDPNYPQAWYDLGMIYELSGNQLEHAIDAYKKVVELVQSCDDLKARVYQLIQIQQNGSQGPLPPPLPYKEFSLHLPHSTKKESLINGLPLPPTWYRNDKNQAPQLDVMYGVPPIPPSAPISTEEQSIILQQQCQVILSSEATHPEPKTWQYIKPHNNQLPILINNLPTERPIPILTQLNTTVPNHQIRGETIQSKISTPELITSPYASEPFILDQPYENKLKTERTTDTKIEIVADGKRSHEIDDLRKGSPYYPKKPKRGSKDDILKISPLSPKSNGNTPVETKACSLLAILEPESSKSPNSNFDKDPKKDRPKNMLEV
ncbi:TPR-like protein [Nadsonia fulvescens var. elongata DSM 6958]|uniref:TPR-like protein n=1 Tax=Nadsonia fulvescens var. elongata DSM 6958 TaxID=857566 RepID=A0A1E3PPV2_9ASCO|nr:TPR-like protein [Nadsonia fulvescens var. elongata DSM 6958]